MVLSRISTVRLISATARSAPDRTAARLRPPSGGNGPRHRTRSRPCIERPGSPDPTAASATVADREDATPVPLAALGFVS